MPAESISETANLNDGTPVPSKPVGTFDGSYAYCTCGWQSSEQISMQDAFYELRFHEKDCPMRAEN